MLYNLIFFLDSNRVEMTWKNYHIIVNCKTRNKKSLDYLLFLRGGRDVSKRRKMNLKRPETVRDFKYQRVLQSHSTSFLNFELSTTSFLLEW